MNPYLNSSLFPAASSSSSSYSNSHYPVIPQPSFQYGYCSSKTRRIERSNKSHRIVRSQQNSESYVGTLSPLLEKPRERFQYDTYHDTTVFPMPQDIKPSGAIGILNFFKDKNCLITGATGFVAKVIVEKILRMVPETGKIFVLIKAKDEEAATKRLKAEIIDSELFKRIKQLHGKHYMEFMMSKLIPVVGNVCESDLGMDTEAQNHIAKEVHVVVNSAATTSFEERYDVALSTNTKGPSRVLDFANKCKNIGLFLHISTAYVSGGERHGIIMEKPLYMGQSIAREITELDIDLEMKLASEIVSSMEEYQVTQKMKELGLERANMYGWPNTYSFTKAMGEMLINSFGGGVPVVILRPAVVESSYREPFPGWIEGYRVLEPLFFNYGKGQLPAVFGDPKTVVDVIPVDMVANVAMAAIAKHGVTVKPEVTVYHVGSSVRNPVSLGALFDYACGHFKSSPLNGNQNCINKMNFFNSLNDFSYYISNEMAKQSGSLEATKLQPHLLTSLQRKSARKAELFIHLAKLYQPYLFYKAWFDDGNTQKLLGEMSYEEMKNFGFDVRSINWEQYISRIHIPGVRKHVFKR